MGGREPGARRHQARTQALRHRRAGDALLLRLRVFQPPGLRGVPRRDGRLGWCVSQQSAVCRLWFCRLLCILMQCAFGRVASPRESGLWHYQVSFPLWKSGRASGAPNLRPSSLTPVCNNFKKKEAIRLKNVFLIIFVVPELERTA